MSEREALIAAIVALAGVIAVLYRSLDARLKACEIDRQQLWQAVGRSRSGLRSARRRSSSRPRTQSRSLRRGKRS
jgi:hypothetical protein